MMNQKYIDHGIFHSKFHKVKAPNQKNQQGNFLFNNKIYGGIRINQKISIRNFAQ